MKSKVERPFSPTKGIRFRLGTLAILLIPLVEGIVKERQQTSGEEGLKAASKFLYQSMLNKKNPLLHRLLNL